MPSVTCTLPAVVGDFWNTGELRVRSIVSWPGTMRSGAPVAVVPTLPLRSSNSTVTGMIGALNRVVRFCSGARPIIVYGHTDCGLPSLSKPGVVNELEKLISVSMLLWAFAAIVIPPLAAVCAGWRLWIDLAPCRNVDATCASSAVTACWLAAVGIDDDEPVHPAAAA